MEQAAEEQSKTLAAALAEVSYYLFVGGSIIGQDRVDGRSRWYYGDDRVGGLAVIVEVGAELWLGTLYSWIKVAFTVPPLSFDSSSRSNTCARLSLGMQRRRQWLTADHGTLLKVFAPAAMRKASNGLFAAGEYQPHCELGGHPSPASRLLLPHHSMAVPAALLWVDLANHLIRLWRHLRAVL